MSERARADGDGARADGFDWHAAGLSVGQVAERMNIAPSAVRFYDDHGLLPSRRTAGNQRRFLADVLCRVAMIRASQKVGLSIAEIREALDALPPGHIPGPKDWRALAARLEQVLRGRIDELFALLNELTTDADPAAPHASPTGPAVTSPELRKQVVAPPNTRGGVRLRW